MTGHVWNRYHTEYNIYRIFKPKTWLKIRKYYEHEQAYELESEKKDNFNKNMQFERT